MGKMMEVWGKSLTTVGSLGQNDGSIALMYPLTSINVPFN